MRINVFFVLVFFFLLIAPVSANSHDDAKNTASGLINDLQGKLPYTADLTESQIDSFGLNSTMMTNPGNYKITIKSASYDEQKGQAVLFINAERNGQSLKVNNPVRFYLPFSGGLAGTNGAKRLQTAAILIIRYLDSLPVGQPVNDDTFVIYADHDGNVYQATTPGLEWPVLRNMPGNTAATDSSRPYLVYTAAHATTSGNYTKMYRYPVTFNTSQLGSGSTPTSAIVRLQYYSKIVTLGGQNESAIVIGNPANPASFAAGDFDELDLATPTELAPRFDFTSTTTGNINFTLNAAGLSALDTSGFTTFYILDGDELDNSFTGTWVSSGARLLRINGVSDATQTNRPFLSGVYTPSGGGDTTPPESLTNLANTTNCSQTNITWTNPPDADFNHTYTMWQNTFDGNLSNTTTHRLKTGLTENTLYTLSTRTCDLTGNCNTTWVNHSVTTGFCGVAPVAAFSANNLTVCQGNPTTFTDSSTNGPLTWNWSFGDGNLSTLQNPQHVYDVIGLMSVNLTANNTYGSDFEYKTNYINVTACAAPTPTPTTPVPTTAPPAGCLYTNITTVIDENNTEWQANAGNYTWGTLIINRTQGNISFYSCYATPTPTPAPTWQPQINPPSPDSIFGTIKNWLKEWLKDVFK